MKTQPTTRPYAHAAHRLFRRATLLAMPLIGIAMLSTGHAAISIIESVDFGDFADDENVAASDLGSFGLGSNTVSGTFGEDGSPVGDGDVFAFTIPAGMLLTSINLTQYDTDVSPMNGSFFAIASGSNVGTSIPTAGNHLSNMLISETGELLDDLEAGAFSGISTLTTPLPAGTYSIFLHEVSALVDYTLDFDVQAVPEPAATPTVMAAGAFLLVALRRLKKVNRTGTV